MPSNTGNADRHDSPLLVTGEAGERTTVSTEAPTAARPGMQLRLARFGGLAALVIAAISFALNGSVPGNGSSGAEASAWFSTHTGRHVVASWCGGIAVLALFCFFLAVRERMRGHGEDLLTRAAWTLSIIVATLLLLGDAPIMAGAMTADARALPLPPASAEVFLHLGIGFYLMMVIALGGYLILLGLAIVRSATLPSLLGYLSIAGGAVALLPYAGFLGFAAVLPLWIIAVTVWLVRTDAPTKPRRGTAAEPIDAA
jgi:hypothetical protein